MLKPALRGDCHNDEMPVMRPLRAARANRRSQLYTFVVSWDTGSGGPVGLYCLCIAYTIVLSANVQLG